MRADHDIHNHSIHSNCCHDPAATVENYAKRAKELGHKVYGLADHMWDPAVPGASRWYQRQPTDRGLLSRNEFPTDLDGIKLLLGVETEYCGLSDTLGMTLETARKFDYIIVPHTHLHMRGFVMADPPEDVDETRYIADFMRDSFLSLMKNPVFLSIAAERPVSIAHTFTPGGQNAERTREIVGAVSDDDLYRAFRIAAGLGVAIEINTGNFQSPEDHFKNEPIIRVLARAHDAGCKFTFGSDAHKVAELENIRLADEVTKIIGIKESDIFEFWK